MYQALYRKWRPKTFSDVVGQEHVTETLQRQVAEGRLSHAYLFTGTRGTGKTTCAKILAKAVNCEHPENGNPCNKCSSCLGIESGGFLDVMELDAASNNGVDHVRALRDEAIYSPAQVKKRVYIIDEVHMLSIAAFNALLKILEEPPEHLMFILATTELHKVPATILSRCQRFAFRRILPREIVGRLNYIAEQEGIDLRPDGAELLAHIADGALRDALSLLDQCAAAGGTIDSAAVLDALGLAGNLQTAQLMDCVLRRDTKAALLLLHRLYGSGKDVGAVLGELRRRRIALYCLIFCAAQVAAMEIGRLLGMLPRFASYYTVAQGLWHILGALIFFVLGVCLIVKAVRKKTVFEHRSEITYKKVVGTAVLTSLDSLLAGVSSRFLDAYWLSCLATLFGVTALCALGGVSVGYHFGYSQKNTAYWIGGALFLVTGVDVLIRLFV